MSASIGTVGSQIAAQVASGGLYGLGCRGCGVTTKPPIRPLAFSSLLDAWLDIVTTKKTPDKKANLKTAAPSKAPKQTQKAVKAKGPAKVAAPKASLAKTAPKAKAPQGHKVAAPKAAKGKGAPAPSKPKAAVASKTIMQSKTPTPKAAAPPNVPKSKAPEII